jgi:prolyl oligopeptidase PreP (S9A serine peptidase family)
MRYIVFQFAFRSRTVLIDVETGKVIAMRVYSKQCRKCCIYAKTGWMVENFPLHNCSKNYEGSSKGMEAKAALEMVKEIFENQSIQACVSEMVLDDDASTRALLSHSLRQQAEKDVNFEWPVDSNGKKYPNQKMSVSYHQIIHPSPF